MTSLELIKQFRIFFVSSLLLFVACEKFTGFDYTTESIGVHSTVHGTIRNTFSREPVAQAEMSIGPIHIATDDDGRYSIEYLIGVDEERDKAISVSISADNYYPLDTSLVIFPPEVRFNLEMVYAAPIIQQVWLGIVPFIFKSADQTYTLPVTQALVFDHQSASTIDTVYTIFYYTKIGSPEIIPDTVGMTFISQLSNEQRYYQAIGSSYVGDNFLFYGRKIEITAYDVENYGDTVTENDQASFSDTPLFPIIVDN